MNVTLHETAPPPPQRETVASVADEVIDAKGRKIRLRELTLLEEQDYLAALPPAHANNPIVLGRALMVARVASIDGEPIAVPKTAIQYRALLQHLGKHGFDAIVKATIPATDDGAEVEQIKN